MAKKKVEEEVILEPEPFPPSPCGFCGQTGEKTVGWDEDGNDIIEQCNECGGDGTLFN